jgi:recombination protein RecA
MPPRPSDLARFRESLTSTYGKRVARRKPGTPREVLSSGSLAVDYALRLGGFLRTRIHELVGPPDSAKTTLMINAMARAQRQYPGLGVGYIDIEGTFDEDWAALNGLDVAAIEHLYADDSEDCSDMARHLVGSGLYSLVVVDSIGGMQSRKTLKKGAADPLPYRNSQVITQMCQALASAARQQDCTVILVNQLRAATGQMASMPDVSAGPRAMQHTTSARVIMSGGSQEPMKKVFEEGQPGEIVCRQFKARVTRYKAGAPGRIAEFWVNNRDTPEYGPAGINAVDEYVSVGVRRGVIERDGAGNYAIPGAERKVKGRDAAIRLLRDRPDLCETVRKSVFSQGGQPT